MKTGVRFIALIIAITAALVTPLVSAQTSPHQLVLTENSSTDLSVTYDGTPLTVTNVQADLWTVALPSTVTLSPSLQGFSEPDNSLANDYVFHSSVHQLLVGSDLTGVGVPLHPDDTTIDGVGTDSSDSGLISARFDDDAATAEAPDTGSTLGLLALALAALIAANRLRSIRLA